MKKICLFLLISVSAFAQLGNVTLKRFSGAPTGACGQLQQAINLSNGDFYDCVNGSWNKVTGAAGGITNSAPANTVMKSDGTNAVASTITDNGTTVTVGTSGTTLSVPGTLSLGCAGTACAFTYGTAASASQSSLLLYGSATAPGYYGSCTDAGGACTYIGASGVAGKLGIFNSAPAADATTFAAMTANTVSVDNEFALWSSTGGATLKRASGTGLARAASGVGSFAELSQDVTTSGSNAVTVVGIQTKAIDAPTTKGDIYVYNGTALKRLGVGFDTQVLTADSAQATGVKWAAAGGSAIATVDFVTNPGALGGSAWQPSSATTYYFGRGAVTATTSDSTLRSYSGVVSPVAGTVSYFQCDMYVGSGISGGSGTATATLEKWNGSTWADMSPTPSVSFGTLAASSSFLATADTTHTPTISVGDILSIKIVTSTFTGSSTMFSKCTIKVTGAS